MATNTLSILKPSVNNLTARIFVRAAGLDFEETDVWGKTTTPEFLAKDPAHLTPLLEEDGLPRGSLWESCAIMQYLCNKHGLDQFYPTDPGERAMVDSAMFYLIGTLLSAGRAGHLPDARFPPVPGRGRPPPRRRRAEGAGTAGRPGRARRAARAPTACSSSTASTFIGGDSPSIADIRLAATLEFLQRDRLRLPGLGARVHERRRGRARRRLLRAGCRRARVRGQRQVPEFMSVPSIELNDGHVDPPARLRRLPDPAGGHGRRRGAALEVGYRHIDTAEMYGNEKGVGEAIRASGLDRADFYVTSKLNNGFHGRTSLGGRSRTRSPRLGSTTWTSS